MTKSRRRRKKEMTITLKSEPLKPSQDGSNNPVTESKRKPRDFKKKGTRGASWIG